MNNINLSKAFNFVQKKMAKNNHEYHNIEHVKKCLVLAHEVFLMHKEKGSEFYEIINISLEGAKPKKLVREIENLVMPLPVFIAILFHDVIYDVKSKSNEKDSADFMYSFMCEKQHSLMYSHGDDIKLAYDIIVGTKSHKLNIDNPRHQYFANIVFDVDLFTFAQPYADFEKDSDNIAKEYMKYFNDSLFYKGRRDFLDSIKNTIIFKTEHFKEYNEAAKYNIEILLEKINQKLIYVY